MNLYTLSVKDEQTDIPAYRHWIRPAVKTGISNNLLFDSHISGLKIDMII